MDISTLSRILEAAPNVHVLVIGDVVLDRFVYGATHRVSREAPVPVMDESSRDSMLGGAGNVVRNVRALGAQASLISIIGADAEGDEIGQRLSAESAGNHLIIMASRPTPTKTRFVCNGQQMLCVDRNPSVDISEAEADIKSAIDRAIDKADIIVLSDYGRGVVSSGISQHLMRIARSSGKRVCVDPRGTDFSRYNGAFIIKPNALELFEESGIDPQTDESAQKALSKVMSNLSDVEHLIVTRGSKGMTEMNTGGHLTHIPAEPRQIYDVSGAGDTAIAMLAVALGSGADLSPAMKAAVHASGEVVTKVGTATVTPTELLIAAGSRRAKGAQRDLEGLLETVARWRAHSLKIGLTNGCFDILHAGHVRYLEQARLACDRLIVGLNSDASVTRLKGAGRPVNDEGARAEVLQGLGSVDDVIVFEEDTPTELIKALRPDVYLKGADYTVEQLRPLGGNIVESYGGEIHLVELVQGKSTTAILEKAAKT